MWYAVVGNGPSSAQPQIAEIIDSCQYVIRMTQFRLHFPNGEGGSRLNAWAHYGSRTMLQRKNVVPPGCYDVWFTQPIHRCEQGSPNLPSISVAKEFAEHRVVEQVPVTIWQETACFLRDEGGSELLRPTTGLTALAMAIARRPVGILIAGFDATTKDRPGWGDNNPTAEWRDVPTHDVLAEKRMMARLADTGMWCGRNVTSKVKWLGRPEL